MLFSHEKNRRSSIGHALRKLAWVVRRGELTRTQDSPRLIFLCGANQAPGELSERRKALRNFLHDKLPHSAVIIAEHFFTSLITHFDSKTNALDAEFFLSRIADDVLIVLESESAFCELGAFSHDDLRKKVIVINNSKFERSESFINVGPVRAISESTSRQAIHYYAMKSDGVSVLDAIGDVYPSLYNALDASRAREELNVDTASIFPKKDEDWSKEALMFASDILYMCGPMTYKELVEIYMSIFGPEKSFNGLNQIVALLNGLKLIDYRVSGDPILSKRDSLFFQYGSITSDLLISFRLFTLKNRRT